jgi:galactonate dehydratase
VATGERFNRLQQFVDLLATRAVSIVQPETLNIGGLGGARKAAAIAEGAEAFVALHQAQSPLNTAINAHIHASIPNFLIQECFDDFLMPWAHEIMHGVPHVQNGYLEPSDAPGIGVEMDEQEMAKYPYGPNKFLRLFEAGWERREY